MSSDKPKDGGPAFPCGPDGGCGPWPGMALRDWFAGQALAGMGSVNCDPDYDYPVCAEIAYRFSDAMLKAREQ